MAVPERMGRYEIREQIGSGGFATVWHGYDERLDNDVAVKVLAENWLQRLDVQDRFPQEARALRRTDSDRVARVYDIDTLGDGRPYFVMSYADRGTLADRLGAGDLPLDQALWYAAERRRLRARRADLPAAGRPRTGHAVLRRYPGPAEPAAPGRRRDRDACARTAARGALARRGRVRRRPHRDHRHAPARHRTLRRHCARNPATAHRIAGAGSSP